MDDLDHKLANFASRLDIMNVKFDSMDDRFDTMEERLTDQKKMYLELKEFFNTHLHRENINFQRFEEKQSNNHALLVEQIGHLKDTDLQNKTAIGVILFFASAIGAGMIYIAKTAIDFILAGLHQS